MTQETRKEWFEDLLPAFSEDYAPDKPFLKECIKKIVKEQKKRDWEEFREMIERIKFVSSTEGWYEEATKKFMDECLEYYKKLLTKLIDSKLAELNKPKE